MSNFSRIEAIEEAIAKELKKLSDNSYMDETLVSAISYALQGGGKRIRPMLSLISADVFGVDTAKIMPYAVALECIHTYSLIHDDLPAMDDDDMRRGRATVHKVYGEAMAILAGDKLENLAYEILFQNINTKNDTNAAMFLSKCAGDMVNGQAQEMSLIDRAMNTITTGDLLSVYRDKTAALIKCAIMMPFYISGGEVGSDIEKDVCNFAGNIGIIFQLVDDMLDTNSGVDDGKITYVNLFGEGKTMEIIAAMELENEHICASTGYQMESLLKYAKMLTDRKI